MYYEQYRKKEKDNRKRERNYPLVRSYLSSQKKGGNRMI